jgi:hypothetical protein
MLDNKHRMPSHRSLFAIIFGERRRQSGGDKIDSMGSDGVDALVLDVEAVLVR